MSGFAGFSPRLLLHPESRNPAARERIALAKRRIQSILDREIAAGRRTLEQKISDQGPAGQRVDPHLVGLAIMDLLETARLKERVVAGDPWYSNPGTSDQAAEAKIGKYAQLHALINSGNFGNLIGDALELVVFKTLDRLYAAQPRYAYHGSFRLSEPKKLARYVKDRPPKNIGARSTLKDPDFLQFGHDSGPLYIECKNRREWLYPRHGLIKNMIIGAIDLGCTPVLIQRRLHYTTITNFFRWAGTQSRMRVTSNTIRPTKATSLLPSNIAARSATPMSRRPKSRIRAQ